ncbi:MAG: hypothetical protein IT335_01665 [Thermomicrobiales bacterium]|jgi:hypothetical protein|nr:hypothetical protein [Thermomicrobiales bacterium]
MRLMKFGLGLLLLRWLPFRFVTRWMLRLAVWGGLGYALVRKFKPEMLSAPVQTVAPREPSAWTAPPIRSAATDFPTPAGSTSTSVADELQAAGTVGIASSFAGDGAAGVEPVAEIAGDEMIDVIVSASMALDEAAEEAPAAFQPNWIRGDGSLDCPPDFPVKGNAHSEIYHNRDSRHYDQTIPDVCFASDEDALAAGYRAPLR